MRQNHRLIGEAVARGVPTVAPVVAEDGNTVVVESGRVYALFPFAAGVQVDRDRLSNNDIQAMGRSLADVLEALRGCDRSLVKEGRYEVCVSEAIREIDRLLSVISELPPGEPSDENAVERLTTRRAWLVEHGVEDGDPFADFDRQPIHGEFQDRNLFLGDGKVSCIIDWDNASWSPPEWEVAPFLDFVAAYDKAKVAAFLAGYRARCKLPDERLDACVWAYGLYRAHDLWLFREVYDRRNDKARRFLTPGRFKPHFERWLRR